MGRTGPDAEWEARESGGIVVSANQFIWDQADRTAIRMIGPDTIDGIPTRIVSFFVELRGGLPIWFRLWVDDGGLVHQAQMRTQGHFMDHRYHQFDADIRIDPPETAATTTDR